MESSSSSSDNLDTYDINLNAAETFLKSLSAIRQPNNVADGHKTNDNVTRNLATNNLQGSFNIGLPSITLSSARDDLYANKSYKKALDNNLPERESVSNIFNIEKDEMRHSLCHTRRYPCNSFSHFQHSNLRSLTQKILPFLSTSVKQLVVICFIQLVLS
jgi:hypothetical protein